VEKNFGWAKISEGTNCLLQFGEQRGKFWAQNGYDRKIFRDKTWTTGLKDAETERSKSLDFWEML